MKQAIEKIAQIADQFVANQELTEDAVPKRYINQVRRFLVDRAKSHFEQNNPGVLDDLEMEDDGEKKAQERVDAVIEAPLASSFDQLAKQYNLSKLDLSAMVASIIATNVPKKDDYPDEEAFEKAMGEYFDALEEQIGNGTLDDLATAIASIHAERNKKAREIGDQVRAQLKAAKK